MATVPHKVVQFQFAPEDDKNYCALLVLTADGALWRKVWNNKAPTEWVREPMPGEDKPAEGGA